MVIVNSITERDAVSNPILYVAQDDGTWKVYQKGDEDSIPVADPIPESRFISVTDFRSLFTTDELLAINQAAYISGDVNVQMLLLKVFTATTGVDLDFIDTVQGVGYLEYINVLTAGRAQEILAGG